MGSHFLEKALEIAGPLTHPYSIAAFGRIDLPSVRQPKPRRRKQSLASKKAADKLGQST
jgi:hypothetical protein